jgi:hypothetical protein
MKTKLLILSTLMMGAIGAQTASAQSTSAPASPNSQMPATRAQVQGDTATSNPSKMVQSEGEKPMKQAERRDSAISTDEPATRNEVKAETKRAAKSGEIQMGNGPGPTPERKMNPSGAKTRSEVQADMPPPRLQPSTIEQKKDPKIGADMRQ